MVLLKADNDKRLIHMNLTYKGKDISKYCTAVEIDNKLLAEFEEEMLNIEKEDKNIKKKSQKEGIINKEDPRIERLNILNGILLFITFYLLYITSYYFLIPLMGIGGCSTCIWAIERGYL